MAHHILDRIAARSFESYKKIIEVLVWSIKLIKTKDSTVRIYQKHFELTHVYLKNNKSMFLKRN